MIIPAPRLCCDAKTHREMVLTRKYLYEDIKKFAENMDTSISSIIQFEKFNSSVSRNFFIDYSGAITTIFHDSYFKIFKQTRIEKKLTQQHIADKLMTSSSTISKFERGLITSSNLFLISYGLLIGIKVTANDDGQIILTTCEPTDKNLPIVEYLDFVNSL